MASRAATSISSAAAAIHLIEAGVRPNRVLAEALGVTHRLVHELIVQPRDDAQLTPEQKLMRAIFGEGGVDHVELVNVGQEVVRHATLAQVGAQAIAFEAAPRG